MIKAAVLIVEDDPRKLSVIKQSIETSAGSGVVLVDHAASVFSAVRAMEARKYDIVVLDLALPIRDGSVVRNDGGMGLLNELEGPRPLRRPTHLVGLTAYPDLRQAALEGFAARLVTVLEYDETRTDWREALERLVSHVAQSTLQGEAGQRPYDYFLALICALDSPELAAIRKVVEWQWQQHSVPFDDGIFFTGQIPTTPDCKVVAAAAGRMGTAATAVLAAKMIELFRPRYIGMTGIAAAVSRKDANLGDVLVAEMCWEWASGKFAGGKAGSRFLAAPRQLQLSPLLTGKLTRLSEERLRLEAIRANWSGPSPDRPLAIRIGPLATGPAVVADATIVAQIKRQQRKVIGIDMEAYAVFAAAENARSPRPTAFVMKSVVDYADHRKADDYHAYASYTSCQAMRALVEDFLVD